MGADDDGNEVLDALRQCMAGLTPRAQLALRLRYADEVDRIEIGKQLGITEHGAKNLMQRAKQQLKECVLTKLT